MFKKIWYVDVRLRLYCFILRAELEIITKRKPGAYWPKIYSIITDKERDLKTVMNNMYEATNRRFVKNTIDWIDYFIALYDHNYLNAGFGASD